MQSCKRNGCNFPKNGYDYCCLMCSKNNGHGNQCTSHRHMFPNNYSKCRRNGCNFPNNGYDYCCLSCSKNGSHGNQCTGNTMINTNSTINNIQNVIYFYVKNMPYYEFTNFYPISFQLDGYWWNSSEHYFQANKFIYESTLYFAIMNCYTARQAFEIARNNDQFKRCDWELVKEQLMFKALITKFNDINLRNLLRNTGSATLIETSSTDYYWGSGATGNGQNRLGYLLMQIRTLI